MLVASHLYGNLYFFIVCVFLLCVCIFITSLVVFLNFCARLFQAASLIGDFNNWNSNADIMTRVWPIGHFA